jgi:hypothetical protein
MNEQEQLRHAFEELREGTFLALLAGPCTAGSHDRRVYGYVT